MKRMLFCVALLLLVGSTLPVAQDAPAPAKVNVRALGSTARGAIETLAKDLGLGVRWPAGAGAAECEYPIWVNVKDAEPAQAARLLCLATGQQVLLDMEAGRLVVAAPGRRPTYPARGYDVSVLAGRHVAYVNQYGKPAIDEEEEDEEELPNGFSSVEHLYYVAGQVLVRLSEPNLTVEPVGDRLLAVGPTARHAELQELLDALAADEPGLNAAARREAELLAAMKAKSAPLLEDVPVASAIASLCASVDSGFVLCRDILAGLEEQHVQLDGKSDAATSLHSLLEAYGLQWDVAGNCLRVCGWNETATGWRVFDCADLLRKLDVALQRQQTIPDKEEGHTRTLKDRNGIEYVADVLRSLLSEDECDAIVHSYGARLVICGHTAGLLRAETFLKELGWEPPKTSK